jgi:Right handed beta helix region
MVAKIRILLFALLFQPIWLAPTVGFSSEFSKKCAPLPSATPRRVFYVDPAHGSITNDGSSGAPWSTLRDVIEKGLIATNVYPTPYNPTAALQRVNLGGRVQPGDLIYLRSGSHGDVVLKGVNDKFITIEAEPGQVPVIGRLKTYGASKWIIRGITFHNEGGWLIEFLNHQWQGPSDNIVFEKNKLQPKSDSDAWTVEDWKRLGTSGVKSDANCSTIRFNQLTSVRNGIMVSGANSIVESNVIDHFADDGIDFLAGDISIVANRIMNNHSIGDGNHNDGIQGWNFSSPGAENILIANNVIINSTSKSLAFPGELQGISIFDGKWRNVRLINNCVITNHWHGVALYGVEDSIVEGNKVIGVDESKPSWITIKNMKPAQGGRPPRNVIVRNNLATRFVLPSDKEQVLSENNQNFGPSNYLDAAHECGLR